MAGEESYLDGQLVERITDHGDGTGTLETFDAAGEVIATELVPRSIPAGELDQPADLLAGLDPAAIRAAVHAGALLVGRAGDLWEALTAISSTNTARPALEIVTDVALQAALAEGAP